jgi:hypothetical protein
MSPVGHFETKSDRYRFKSIGLILPQELTFWPRQRDAIFSWRVV